MSLILGMDIYVFIAWIGTIISAILCIIYGVYHELFKKKYKNKKSKDKPKKTKDKEEK
jgi:hypothetical protein